MQGVGGDSSVSARHAPGWQPQTDTETETGHAQRKGERAKLG